MATCSEQQLRDECGVLQAIAQADDAACSWDDDDVEGGLEGGSGGSWEGGSDGGNSDGGSGGLASLAASLGLEVAHHGADTEGAMLQLLRTNMRVYTRWDESASVALMAAPNIETVQLFQEAGAAARPPGVQKPLVGFVRWAEEGASETSEKSEKHAFVYELQIADGWRNLGLGSALLEEVRQLTWHQCRDRLVLEVLDDNTGAQRLYRRLGLSSTRGNTEGDASVLRYESFCSSCVDWEVRLD